MSDCRICSANDARIRLLRLSVMTVLIRVLFALVLVGTSAGTPDGLGQSSEKGWGIPDGPQNCEMNLQNLEYLRDLIKNQSKGTGFLIIVARLGKGERQPSLNHRRLYNVRLKLTLINVPKDSIITAEGEQVHGFGRLEFYWRGELVGALLAHKARDICVGCCGPDERFYPYKRKGVRKQRLGSQDLGSSQDLGQGPDFAMLGEPNRGQASDLAILYRLSATPVLNPQMPTSPKL